MDSDELKNIINKLDKEVPKENAAVLIEQYGGGPDESQIFANTNGYLRLGIEFLKAAIADIGSTETRENSIDVNLEYLEHPDSSIWFDYFERTEDLVISREHKETLKERFIGGTIFIGVIVFIGFAIYGFFSFIRQCT